MPEAGSGGGSAPSALRGVATSLLGLAQVRVELFGVELREEGERLLGALALIGVATAFALLALGSLTALLVVAFWDGPRLVLLAVLAALYAAAAFAAWRAGRRALARSGAAFATPAEEIRRDREALLG